MWWLGAATAAPAVTYDYGYGRTTGYDATKTYYQQAQGNTTYAAAAQPYDAAGQSAAKVAGYQTAQYVAGPTRNNVQAKAAVAAATYNSNQTYAPQTTYPQNTQANSAPKRKWPGHLAASRYICSILNCELNLFQKQQQEQLPVITPHMMRLFIIQLRCKYLSRRTRWLFLDRQFD